MNQKNNQEIIKMKFSVKFRFVVFRPFIDEVLTGKVKTSSKEGLHGMLLMQYLFYKIQYALFHKIILLFH